MPWYAQVNISGFVNWQQYFIVFCTYVRIFSIVSRNTDQHNLFVVDSPGTFFARAFVQKIVEKGII